MDNLALISPAILYTTTPHLGTRPQMTRIYKHYEFGAPGYGRLSMTSYPGETFSDDDFYLSESGLVGEQYACSSTFAVQCSTAAARMQYSCSQKSRSLCVLAPAWKGRVVWN